MSSGTPSVPAALIGTSPQGTPSPPQSPGTEVTANQAAGPSFKAEKKTGIGADDSKKYVSQMVIDWDSCFVLPISMGGMWTELGSGADMLTAVLLLPSGVDGMNSSLNVSDDGMSLEMDIRLPDVLQDVRLLCAKWTTPDEDGNRMLEHYSPEIHALESGLRALRPTSSTLLHAHVRIKLPFKARKQFELVDAARVRNAQYVLFTVRGYDDSYSRKDFMKTVSFDNVDV